MFTLLKGKHFKVKLLYFKEGGEISRQRHKMREELWLFVFGRGILSQRNEERLATHEPVVGDYIVVDKGVWHHFKADEPTLVLEIQYGDKCSERDIERA